MICKVEQKVLVIEGGKKAICTTCEVFVMLHCSEQACGWRLYSKVMAQLMVWWTLTDEKCKFLPLNRCTARKGSRAGRKIERWFKHQDKKVCMHARSLLILVKNIFSWKEMWLLEGEVCCVWAGGQVKQDEGLWVLLFPCMRLLNVRAELPPVGCQLQWPGGQFVLFLVQ